MSPQPTPQAPAHTVCGHGLDTQRCYQAMADKDAAWDGLFFTGVTSTGIYCRPVCRVKLPKQAHCRFFETAAQAEAHGFRPCLRCRPELAPARRFWSTTDAGAVLAEYAAQQLQCALERGDKPASITTLAAQLGVSDRHLRRMFMRHWHVSPMQFLQTQRLLSAKQWLHDSPMSVAQVAQASGFGSSRRMYAAFAQHYRLSPGQLRRPGHKHAPDPHQGTTVVLHYRPPCQIAPLWRFFKDRALENMEMWDGEGPHAVLRKTVRGVRGQHTLLGWLQAHWHPTQPQLHLCVSPSLVTVLPDLVAQVRHWLDLDAEPARIAQVIGHDFPEALGQRLPGCLDGFELAVRAVLGQQISVKAARTLGQRLVNALGEPCQTPWPELNKTFPSPMCLAQENIAPLLGSLGLVRQRQQAIRALAQAVASGALQLNPTTRPEPTLQALMALPGIGPWTAHYIAMRALHWQNAWPVQDVALQNALRVRQHPHPTQALEQLGQAWQPFRSYALMAAWEHGTSPPELHT